MQPNEHLKRVMKILIFAFLCTEMRTNKLILGKRELMRKWYRLFNWVYGFIFKTKTRYFNLNILVNI